MVVLRSPRSFLVHALAALVVLALTPAGAVAGSVGLASVLNKFTVTNDSIVNGNPTAATDFHVKIHSDDEDLHVKRNGITGGAFSSNGVDGDGTHDVEISFFTGSVPFDGKNTFRIELEEQKNTIRITDAFWTVNFNQRTSRAFIPGFRVVGDPEYTIFNDFDTPLGIRDLQFLINVPEMADANLIPGLTPGFGSPLPDFILPAGGFLTLNLPGTIDPGNFLYAQMQLFDAASGETTGAAIQGHQAAPVPEPTTIVLVGVGLATAAARRRKR